MHAEEISRLAAPIQVLLNGAGVNWCWLREPGHIGSVTDGVLEFDAWCDGATAPRAAAALLRAGWAVHSGRAVSAPGRRVLSALLRFDRPAPGPVATLRLELAIGALRAAALPYRDEGDVKRDIRPRDGIPYAGGATLLAILITRCALRGDLAGERWRRARAAWGDATPEAQDAWRQDAARLLGAGIARSLERALASGEEPRPVPRGALRATLRYYLARPRLAQNLLKWLRARRAKGRTHPRGFVVSFIGTDGAGKSTTIEAIRERLEADGRAVHVTYWGRARSRSALTQGLRDAVTRVTGIAARDAKPPSDPGRASPPSWPERCAASAGAAIYLLDYWYRRLTEVRRHTRRGGVVLMDRGPTDLKVMYAAFAPARGLWKLAPRAALTVHCTAGRATILRRKRERATDVVDAHLRDYADAIRWLRGHGAAAMEYRTEDTDAGDIDRLAAIVRAVGRVRAGHLDPELIPVLTG